MTGLTNKRVVITGGASGIGAATVERFLREGARVAVIDRDESGGEALRQRHPNLAGVINADVADAAAVDGAFQELDALLGGLDVASNNAGISLRHDFMNITSGRAATAGQHGTFLRRVRSPIPIAPIQSGQPAATSRR